MKKLTIINTEDVPDIIFVLESKVIPSGVRYTPKGCVNLLDDLYYVLDPERWNELNQPCALGTCANPEWTCNTCPFANRRPFSEKLQWIAKSNYKREREAILYWRRFKNNKL